MNAPESEFNITGERSKSPFRLRKANQLLMVLQQDLREQTAKGLEYIQDLDEDEPAIIAISHTTGYDVPFGIATLGEDLDMVVGDQSTHHEIGKEFNAYLWYRLLGRKNWLPISYEWHGETKRASRFNPEDAVAMERAMDMGKSVLLAAHSPLAVDADGRAVPPRPGLLAAYVASHSKRRVLPVGVSYSSIEGSRKHDVQLKVGEPFYFEGFANTEQIQHLSKLSRMGHSNDENEALLREEISRLRLDGRAILTIVQSLQNLDEGYPVIDKSYTKE